jgi:hypothetical protein
MIRQLSTWLLVALAGGGLIVGCGSSGSSTSSTQSSVSVPGGAAGVTSTSTSAGAATTSTSPTSFPTSSVGVAEAVAVCRSVVRREPTLSAGLKAKVEGICDKAAHGNLAAARAAGKEVCREVIEASPIPGPAKAQALAACERG